MGGRGLISEQEINGSTVSNIFVAAASLQDTGNYTCEAPALAANTSVNLHVLVDGEWRVPKCLFCFSLSKNRHMRTVFENHRKSLIQHCERSELPLHFSGQKLI